MTDLSITQQQDLATEFIDAVGQYEIDTALAVRILGAIGVMTNEALVLELAQDLREAQHLDDDPDNVRHIYPAADWRDQAAVNTMAASESASIREYVAKKVTDLIVTRLTAVAS